METPIFEGSFKSSANVRSTDSCGAVPVIIRYITAPTAYTSVQDPRFPLLRYCSSGAYPLFKIMDRLLEFAVVT